MAISLPSRTDAIMPHPHEQKLQEVVNSVTFESFSFCVAALIVGTSISPPSASPTPPPTVALNHSLRLIDGRLPVDQVLRAFEECSDSSFLPADIDSVPLRSRLVVADHPTQRCAPQLLGSLRSSR